MKTINRIIKSLEENGIGFDWTGFSQSVLLQKHILLEQYIKELCRLLNCKPDCITDPKRLIWRLYANKIYPASLSFEFLKENRTACREYELLYSYKKTVQFLKQYGDTLKARLVDGRLHGTWTMDGAVTGRMTCKEPNLQAFPAEVKNFFQPREGYCLIFCDYSQIELRVLAELSQDANMIKAFAANTDIHTKTASAIFNKPFTAITAQERTIAKRVNFGICYGISVQGLCDVVNNKTDVNLSFEEANRLKKSFYDTYPQIREYHNHLLTTETIESLGGRQWVNYPRGIARVNLPVQASAAEGLKLSLDILVNSLPDDCYLVNVIHDEIIIEAPNNDCIEQNSTLLTQSMIAGMGMLVKSLPVEVKITYKF